MFNIISKILDAMKTNSQMDAMYNESKQLLMDSDYVFRYSVNRFRHRDKVSENINVHDYDKKINQAEISIRKKAILHLLMESEVKASTSVLTLALISHDMERIGDYSKNIYDLSEEYSDSIDLGQYNADLNEIEAIIFEELRLSIKHFEGNPKQVHEGISRSLTEANVLIEKNLKLAKDNADNSGLANNRDLINFVMYLRFLKRVSSHLRNVSTSYHNPIDRIGFNIEEN